MKVKRCSNCKLFYDSEVFSQCPYCEKEETKKPEAAPETEAREIKVVLSRKKAEKQEDSFTPHTSVEHQVISAQVEKTEEEKPVVPAEPVVPTEPIIPVAPVIPAEPDTPVEPVAPATMSNCAVGWLVCLKGEYFGKSFVLKPGVNQIGRDTETQISVPEEKSVLMQNHAAVIYDANVNKFILKPGDTRGLTYLNDDLKVSQCLLKPGDKIKIGDISFIFVPLCGSKFNWDDYVK